MTIIKCVPLSKGRIEKYKGREVVFVHQMKFKSEEELNEYLSKHQKIFNDFAGTAFNELQKEYLHADKIIVFGYLINRSEIDQVGYVGDIEILCKEDRLSLEKILRDKGKVAPIEFWG